MQKNNYPGQQLSDLPDDFVQETVKSLKQLNDMGRPETDAIFSVLPGYRESTWH